MFICPCEPWGSVCGHKKLGLAFRNSLLVIFARSRNILKVLNARAQCHYLLLNSPVKPRSWAVKHEWLDMLRQTDTLTQQLLGWFTNLSYLGLQMCNHYAVHKSMGLGVLSFLASLVICYWCIFKHKANIHPWSVSIMGANKDKKMKSDLNYIISGIQLNTQQRNEILLWNFDNTFLHEQLDKLK